MRIQQVAKSILSVPAFMRKVIVRSPYYARVSAKTLIIFTSFFAILLLYLLHGVFSLMNHVPFLSQRLTPLLSRYFHGVERVYNTAVDKLEALRPFKIKRKYLIFVSLENLKMRKSRSLITILGMSVGVGIIVLLLSLGYGIEKLVINQIAGLNELKMVDVSAGESSKASLTTDAVKQMKKLENVNNIIPLISVVGRLNYKNAKTDILVHAVPKEYFKIARQDIIHGNYFTQAPDFDLDQIAYKQEVAGAESEMPTAALGDRVKEQAIIVTLLPGEEIPVYEDCRISSDILGFATRGQGTIRGFEMYGGEYAPYDLGRTAVDIDKKEYLGEWVMAEYPVLSAEKIDLPGIEEEAAAVWKVGCVPKKYVQVIDDLQIEKAEVLGEATESAVLAANGNSALENTVSTAIDSLFDLTVATDSGIFAQLEEASGSGEIEIVYTTQQADQEKKEQVLQFNKPISGTAVASSGLLNLLGIDPADHKSQNINVSFIIIRSLLPEINGRVLTSEQTYNIIGVVDDETQFIYIPIQDMSILGISNYSQVKVQLEDEKKMSNIRESIESMGYKTASTADTVAQVESFFGSLRGVLGLLGFIALGVASLGMFNTLTVSLLERSREIGGMKTMGMVSGEIQELFLAEAMIMGFGGGMGGLMLGAVIGKLISYVVSIIAISQGVGYLELTHIPLSLIVFIISCSFVVGVITGLYPAYRAKKISALNALRYE